MISRSIKGVCSELIAIKDFLKKGYYVAKSLDPQCPFDIVVVDKKGKATLYDVKSISYRKTQSYNCKPGDTINRSISKKQKSLGVKIYYAERTQKLYYWNDYTFLRYQNIYMKSDKKEYVYFIILNMANKIWVINDKSCIFVADYSATNYARITHRKCGDGNKNKKTRLVKGEAAYWGKL